MTEDTYALMNGSYDVHTNYHYSFEEPSYENKDRARRFKQDVLKHPELEAIKAIPQG